MTIKRKLKNYRDTSNFAGIRKSRLDRSAAARTKRRAAKKEYRLHKAQIKRAAKIRRLKMTHTEKQFNALRSKFLKTIRPPLPRRPGAKRPSVFKSAIKSVKHAIKPLKRAIKTITKRVTRPRKTAKRTGMKGS